MINSSIYKILHGPESLDLPYIFTQMLQNRKQHIIKFVRKMYDTRFLCEYFKYSVEADNKCSIYVALRYFGVISDEKLKYLNDTNDSMGPIQNVNWNINTLNSYSTRYALYDVL